MSRKWIQKVRRWTLDDLLLTAAVVALLALVLP